MASGTARPGGTRMELHLSDLRLDAKNPRFGGLSDSSEQADILDHIVDTFTVDDVLSSLAVNGYFDAEPMVCRAEDDGSYTVVEGSCRASLAPTPSGKRPMACFGGSEATPSGVTFGLYGGASLDHGCRSALESLVSSFAHLPLIVADWREPMKPAN